MRSLVISGFMATGKTTVAPRVAARLGVAFVDTDEVLAHEAGCSIAELWTRHGEAHFRHRELALVERLLGDGVPRVLAFGGGTVTIRRARHLALDRAVLVTLTASPETIAGRVPDVATRPNLAIGDPVERARELLDARADAYAECHLALSTDALDPDAVADSIVAAFERDPLCVPLGGRSYAIDVVLDAPARLTDAVACAAPSSVIVVSDAIVQRARGDALEKAVGPLAIQGIRVTLPAGERHKTLASVSTIWDAALGAGIDRDAVVLAFGGGVVGDLAGFAASALLRGIRVIQVPTTLLAMVDASVGGKTGFDHPTGKNLIGAFHQPAAVVADLSHLSTLPARELRAGLAEIVKIALVVDAPLLASLEANAEALAAGDLDALLPIVRHAIEAKIRVVRDDERETGRRAVLNLGHTIGHALEAHGGFTKYLHGEAVALGTVAELRMTAAMGLGDAALVERARVLFRRMGLPTDASAAEIGASWPFVGKDKKRAGASIRLPVVTAPGESSVQSVPLRQLEHAARAPG
jgi:shikimate kinase / 3-dehydroquinate synthase